MQARKLRCWPGVTKFSDILRAREERLGERRRVAERYLTLGVGESTYCLSCVDDLETEITPCTREADAKYLPNGKREPLFRG